MTRRGKIARQSHAVRTTLNERLRDSEPGPALLDWLNGLPAVQKVLTAQFGGVPISEQNLSEWRQGGYQDWLARQDTADFVDQISEQARDLQVAVGKDLIFSDHLSLVLTAELARATQALLTGQEYPADRWDRLKGLVRVLNELRRGDHQAARVEIESDKWYEAWQTLDAERWDKVRDAQFHAKTLEILIEQRRARRAKRAKTNQPAQPVEPTAAGTTDNGSLITSPPELPASRDDRIHPDAPHGSPSPGGEGRGEGGLILSSSSSSSSVCSPDPSDSGQNRVAQT